MHFSNAMLSLLSGMAIYLELSPLKLCDSVSLWLHLLPTHHHHHQVIEAMGGVQSIKAGCYLISLSYLTLNLQREIPKLVKGGVTKLMTVTPRCHYLPS